MMNPVLFATMLAAAAGGPDALAEVTEALPDLSGPPPKRHPRVGVDVPADFYAAEQKKLQRPPTAEQNAAALKRARKNLVRLVQGSASGEQIATAWKAYAAAGGKLRALPIGVFDVVAVFAFTP
jgi:hypothetical protein